MQINANFQQINLKLFCFSKNSNSIDFKLPFPIEIWRCLADLIVAALVLHPLLWPFIGWSFTGSRFRPAP